MEEKLDGSKKEELYRLIGEMQIPLSERSRKRIDNYRYADNTEIRIVSSGIEVRTSFADGQRQYLGVKRDGTDAVVGGFNADGRVGQLRD